MYKYISKSNEDTIIFAKKLAKFLNKKDSLILLGDLGAGKTKFTEGILSYFGLENEISSPTFTIVNEYNSKNINIYHFDLYRLSDIDEFYSMGGEEYLENGICIFEWGEMIKELSPKDYVIINISKDSHDENIRIFEIEPFGKFTKIISELLKGDTK